MDDGGNEGPCTLESCRNVHENLKLLLLRTKRQAADLQNYSKIQAENETLRMKLVSIEDTLRTWTSRAQDAVNGKELAEGELKQIQSTTEYYRKKVTLLQEQADESEKHKEQANHWRDKYDSICALTEKLESNNIEIKQKYEASVKTMETVGKKMLSHQETIKVLKAEKTDNAQKQRKLDKYLKSAIQVIDSLSQSTNLNRQPKEIQDLVKVFRRDDIRLFFNSEQYKNDSQPSTSNAPDPDEAGPAPPPPARRGRAVVIRTLSDDDENDEEEDEDVDEETDEEVDREVRKLEKFVINQAPRARKRADFEPKMMELKARKGAPKLLRAQDIPAKNWPPGIKKPEAKDHGWLVNSKTTHSKTVPTSDFDAIAQATEVRKRALLGAGGPEATSSGATSIHGKKGKTVREQQQDMMKGETVKQRVARMKAEAAGKTVAPVPVEAGKDLEPLEPLAVLQNPKDLETMKNPENPHRTRYQSFKLSERGTDSEEEEEPEPKRRGRPARGPSSGPSRASTPMPTRRSSRLSTMSTEPPPTPRTPRESRGRTESVLPAATTESRTTRPRSRSSHSNSSSTRGERARARSVLRGELEEDPAPRAPEQEDATSSGAPSAPRAPEVVEENLGDVVRRRLGMETKKRAAPALSTSGPPLRTRRMERVKAPVVTKKVTPEEEKVPEKVTEKVIEKVMEKVPEKVSEKVTEKVMEKVTEKVTEEVPEKIAEKVMEKVPEAAQEPAPKSSLDFGNISSSSNEEEEARAPAGADDVEPGVPVEPIEDDSSSESSSDSDDSVILRTRPTYEYDDDYDFAPDDPEIMAARASRQDPGSPELVKLDDSMDEEPKELVVDEEPDAQEEAQKTPEKPETAPELTQKSSEKTEPEPPKSAPEAPEPRKPAPARQKSVISPEKPSKMVQERPKQVETPEKPAEITPKTTEMASKQKESAPEPPKYVNFDPKMPESAPKTAPEPQRMAEISQKSAPEPPKSKESTPKLSDSASKSAPKALEALQIPTKPLPSIPIKSPKQMIVCQYGLEISDSEEEEEEEEEEELKIWEEPTSGPAPEAVVPKVILPPEPVKIQAPPTSVAPPTSMAPKPVVPQAPPTSMAPKPVVPQAPPTSMAPKPVVPQAPPTSFAPKPMVSQAPPTSAQTTKTTKPTPPLKAPPTTMPKIDDDDLVAGILSGARAPTRAPPVPKKAPPTSRPALSKPVAPPTSSGPLKRQAPPTSEENPPKRQYTKKEVPIIEAAPLKRGRSVRRPSDDVPSTSSASEPTTSEVKGPPPPAPVKTILIDAPTRPRGKNIKMEQKPVGLKEAMAKSAERGGKRVNKFKTHLRQALDLKLPVQELKRPMEEKGVILDTSIPLSPSDAVDVMMEFLRETAAGDMWAVLNRQRLDMNLMPLMNTEEQNFLQVSVTLNEQDQKLLELFIGRILYEVSLRDSIDSKQCGRLVRLFCHALRFANQLSCLEGLDEEDDRETILHHQKSMWMHQLFMVLFHKHPTQLMKSLAYCLISDVSEFCRFVVDELEKDPMSSEFQFAFRILLHGDSEQAGVINWLLGAKFQMAYVIHLSSEEITMAADLAHRRFLEGATTLKSSIFLAKSGAPEVLSVAFRLLKDQMSLVDRQFLEPKDKEKELKHKTVFSVPTITTKMSGSDAVTFKKEAEWQKTVLLVLIDNPTSRHYVEIMKALTMISVQVVAFREIVDSSDVENFVDQSGVDALREALQHFLDLISEFTNFPLKPSMLPGASDPSQSVPSTSNQD